MKSLRTHPWYPLTHTLVRDILPFLGITTIGRTITSSERSDQRRGGRGKTVSLGSFGNKVHVQVSHERFSCPFSVPTDCK